MKAAYLHPRFLVFLSFLAFAYTVRSQQYSAGINTETPNPNAVLHLVAPNGDQGLIIPTLTTAQRTGLGTGLSATENGLIVFDSDQGLFYYYFGGWIALTTPGSETDPTVAANVKDGVDWTELTGIPGVFADNTDDVNDLDADPANETITSAALAGNTLTITEAGTPYSVDLSSIAGASQDLDFTANQLSLSGDPTPTVVDFTGWDTNVADDLTTANVGTGANQIVQLDGTGALPAVDGGNLSGILSTVASDGTTITGDGVGTPLAVNVGTTANQIVQLDGAGSLPAVDGSNLTGISTALAAGSVTTTEILDGTIADIDIGSVDWGKITTGVPAGFADGTDDGLTVVTTDITLVGDGTGATPLSINRVNPAVIAGGGATLGQILEFNGTNWVPVANMALADGTTITGDGDATALAVNVGTGANQIVQLNGTSQLPAVDGSLLTNVNASTLAVDAVTSAAIANGTIVDIDVSGTANIAATKLQNTVMVETENVSLLNNDAAYISAVVSDATLNGTGIAGTPLTVNAGTGPNQLVQLNGTSQLPAVDGSLLSNVNATTVAADAVASAQISNGSIIDIDISGTANIAATKLQGTVMVETENVSLLTNDAGYLGLPANQTITNAADLLRLVNDGTGGSGSFEINNLANASNALNATTNGTGSALRVSHGGTGVGTGVDVSVSQATNTGPGIRVSHAGLGPGIEITATTGPPLSIPGGALGEVLTSDALGNITLQPGGISLPYIQSVANVADLFQLTNTGTGGAGNFQISNGANASNALNVATDGTGAAIRAQQSGTAGPAMDLSISNAGNISPGLFISHAGAGSAIDINLGAANTSPGFNIFSSGSGQVVSAATTGTGSAGRFEINNGANTSPVIEVLNTGVGPDIRLPTGAAVGYVLTSNDATGNASWQPGGITLPYSNVQADADTLFNLTNPGSAPAAGFSAAGVAAVFTSTTGATAVLVDGNIEFLDGANRDFGILPNLTGPGDILNVYSGDASGPGGDGGDLVLSSGLASVTGNGGNVLLVPGAGAGGGNFGGVFINGITRFGNPNATFGGIIELENDGGTASIGIEADPLMAGPYTIRLPATQGAGALTNDGTGILSWSGGGAFSQDANQNLVAISAAAPTGTDNFIAGNAAGSLSAGSNNIAIGEGAGGALAGGSNNFFMGFDVGGPNMINGNSNILFGSGGRNNDDTDNNVGIGQNVIVAGGSATAIGAFSIATGANSLALGTGATVALPNVGVIGDPSNPIDIGIGTGTPSARLSVHTIASETVDVLSLTNNGDAGRALSINIPATINADPAILLAQNADGVGIDARITNASSTATLMTAQHQGDAPVAFFNQANGASTAPVINLAKSGGGPDIQLSGVGTVFNIPGSTPGFVATVTNAAGDVTFQPAPAGGFSLDANDNLLGNTTVAALTTGSDNFLAGLNSGNSLTTGSDNVYIGQLAGFNNIDGLSNIGIGPGAGQNITSGQGNVLIGQGAGGGSLTTGVGNVIIGQGASTIDNASPHVAIGQSAAADGNLAVAIGPSASATGDGSIAIGAGVTVATNDVAVIGNPTSIFGVGIGTNTPAARLHVERAVGSGGNVVTGTNLGGSGSAGFFDINNAGNASDVISATTNGTGGAGRFVINNTGNAVSAILASTNGSGTGLFVDHAGTGVTGDAVSITHAAGATTGRGITIDMNGAGAQGLFIGGTNPASSSIETDGDVLFRKNFITPTVAYDVGGSGPLLPNTSRLIRLTNLPDIDIDEINAAGARDGQEILLVVEVAGTTFNVNSGTINIRLDNNNPFTMTTGSSLHLIYIESLSQWVEIGRSQ